uniref:P2X purinoceptor 7-like n=1 Tax=Crassostrea virginica TaxID=6565 RepID=A0A8B8C775_CRAVI|nr:P2X purinoceptor 7-like [Crassostrea virginica]
MDSERVESTDSESTEETVVSRRGRGRPRKVRGGRGRPRSELQQRRGTKRQQSPVSETVSALDERKKDIERRIDALSPEEMRDTLGRVVHDNPEYLFDILRERDPHPPENSGNSRPSWCICTFCREMPTQAERLCCGKSQGNCISRLPDFRVLMLDEAVLALARLYRQDILAMPEDEDRNRANRHTAYRQFVLWHHGRLGAGDRRVIPSCCVWRIREKFPDPFGQYIGFKTDRLQ